MKRAILTNRQRSFLKKIGESPEITTQFYLTGGTALAEYYLHHRYSEDLDFFSETEVVPMQINARLKQEKKSLGFLKIDFQQNFNRNLYFLHFPDEILKVEFTFFPFERIEKSPPRNGITVDSLIDIATNKLFTIYQQSRARDYIDLFTIVQKQNMSMQDLVKKARVKFDCHIDPMQLGTQFVKATDVKDYPRMITRLNDVEWKKFFVEEAKKLRGDILTQ